MARLAPLLALLLAACGQTGPLYLEQPTGQTPPTPPPARPAPPPDSAPGTQTAPGTPAP